MAAEKLDCTEADLVDKTQKLTAVERELRKSQDECDVLRCNYTLCGTAPQ